jgi:hypothetical protein
MSIWPSEGRGPPNAVEGNGGKEEGQFGDEDRGDCDDVAWRPLWERRCWRQHRWEVRVII